MFIRDTMRIPNPLQRTKVHSSIGTSKTHERTHNESGDQETCPKVFHKVVENKDTNETTGRFRLGRQPPTVVGFLVDLTLETFENPVNMDLHRVKGVVDYGS